MFLLIGLIASIAGTYLTKPTDPKVLENFYKTTRPFGLWGARFRNLLSPEQRIKMQKEHRYDLIAVPFVLAWQVSFYLLLAQLVIHDFKSLGITSTVFVISLIGMYFFWYTKLPPHQTQATEQSTSLGPED